MKFLQILGIVMVCMLAIIAFKLVVMVAIGLWCLYLLIKVFFAVYYSISPQAKQRHLEEEALRQAELDEKQRKVDSATIWNREQSEEVRRRAEKIRQDARDADVQSEPYAYEVGKHGNESLAIRYGIANTVKKTKERWYYAKGGERTRSPDGDIVYYADAKSIRLQKVGRIGESKYDVLLTDFRNRPAKAVIEVGTEVVKTFYPMDSSWFAKHADMELVLKGNGSFSLKELAAIHIEKTIGK